MIKKELGPDALILSTRTVRSGKLGMIGKPMLEITAAIDNDFSSDKADSTKSGPPSISRIKSTPPKTYSGKKTNGKKGNFQAVVDDEVNLHLKDQTQSFTNSAQNEKIFTDEGRHSADQGEIRSEVRELKELVAGLSSQIQVLSKNKGPNPDNQLKIDSLDHANSLASTPLKGDHILSLLIKKGVEVETARTITGFLRESLTDVQLGDTDNLSEAITSTLENLIDASPPQFAPDDSQRRIALVGPTGVGKTTTIAKICASFLSKHSKSVALITIDTYRIAAVEQLKIYGEIMHLPVEVVISPNQLEEALSRHKDKNLILIDTAGRSPQDSCRIDELAAFLKPEFNIDIHLVLSATNRENELLDTLKNFNRLGLCNTIFTKVDECSSLGVILNIQLQNPTPLSYVANGQRVPEDLIEATPKNVAELIMNQDQGSIHG